MKSEQKGEKLNEKANLGTKLMRMFQDFVVSSSENWHENSTTKYLDRLSDALAPKSQLKYTTQNQTFLKITAIFIC